VEHTIAKRLASRVLGALKVDPYGNLFEDRTNERFRKFLSPRWVVARINLAIFEHRHPDVPWITRDAIRMLEEHLRRDHVGFEWGSGNGTLWLLRRTKSLTSVEHFRPWADKVKQKLADAGVKNADYRYVDESKYCDVIDEFPDEHFDYVIVDGLFRDTAMIKSMPKLKHGGWLVLDNVNWYLPSESRTPQSRSRKAGPATELWGEVERRLASWKTTWTTNGVNDTAIFVKP
jgi:predicted O-methyltransferase YrrM